MTAHKIDQRSGSAGVSPEVPENGVLLTDQSLRLIALDRRGLAILNDVSGVSNVRERNGDVSHLRIPGEISDALRTRAPEEWFGLQIRFVGKLYNYHCNVYPVEPQNDILKQAVVTLYLQRETSPNSAILQIVSQCGLTPREEGVLKGISLGLTTKEVALLLKISPNTVKTYLHSIMIKLNVTTRAGIVGKLLNCEHAAHQNGQLWQR